MDEPKKNIDQEWKDSVAKEKEKAVKPDNFSVPQADFGFFVTTMAIQAAIALGALVNPQTNKKEEDLSQAKFLIDTLGMIKEKTKGNLTEEEANIIENVLYELRIQYLEKTGSGNQGPNK